MKILLATECGGHPFWQRNKYDFTMLDTESETATKLNFSDLFNNKSENWQYGEVEYYIRKDGVYARFFACGSGFGKVPRGDEFLLIACDEYDKVIILPSEEKRRQNASTTETGKTTLILNTMPIIETPPQQTKKQRRQEESKLQARCFTWCWNEHPETRRLLFHVENEGTHSNARDGARRKSMGLVAGVSDLILLMPRGKWHALCIEMKTTDRNSGQSDDQKTWQKLVEAQGYRYEVVRTEEEFKKLINEYLQYGHL